MSYSTDTLKLRDGLILHLHKWEIENPTKIMFLIHGSVEHAKRYDYFARKLNQAGFSVIAPDQRGHGLTAIESGEFSHFGDEDGFIRATDDLIEVLEYINKLYPTLPKSVFGHSLGSFLTRNLISKRGNDFKAAVISGTSWGNILELKGGLFLCKAWSLFANKNKPNQKFNDFFWSQLNAKVKNHKGTLDFINSDENEVKKYMEDPLNGNTITIEFGMQMSVALLTLREDNVYKSTPDNLSIFLVSGMDDPLANKGKNIDIIAKKYKEFGTDDVTVKMYEGARHEIINEPIKDIVISDIINWLNNKI